MVTPTFYPARHNLQPSETPADLVDSPQSTMGLYYFEVYIIRIYMRPANALARRRGSRGRLGWSGASTR